MKNVIEINDPKYPKLLGQIKNPPEKLYYKGNWDDSIFERCLTVAGSRRMTSYGRRVARELVSEIAAAGITIVSGFMYGIDATSHKAALDAGGRTIAVMPCGIEVIHPEHQKGLYDEILGDEGIIVSELENTHPPALWTYPRRNRIMAGLSQATLIIEAGAKSGSLITANLAREYKRRLLAVPGPITSTLSGGTLGLIREGADMITSAREVVEIYESEFSGETLSEKHKKTNKVSTKFSGLSILEQSILEELQQEPLEIDMLLRLTEVSASEIGTILSLMQIKGLLYKEEAKYYVK